MAGVVTLYSLSATRRETVTRPEHLRRLVEAGLALLQGTNRIGKGKRRADLVGALVVVSTVVFALGVIGPASSTLACARNAEMNYLMVDTTATGVGY